MTTTSALHWIGCPCADCRLRVSRPLDRADNAALIDLLTGQLPGGTRQPVRLVLEVEIPSGGRSLAEARPVRVEVRAVAQGGETLPLPNGDLNPALLRPLTSLLRRD
ncbi:hypothetical protein [Kitasatospora sp. NPDC088134]|uniref:hypothetical protein n=1 Tax=Kitasatospora sp. NPDC088134 TaxID=3364071 RepID=UPI003825A9A3